MDMNLQHSEPAIISYPDIYNTLYFRTTWLINISNQEFRTEWTKIVCFSVRCIPSFLCSSDSFIKIVHAAFCAVADSFINILRKRNMSRRCFSSKQNWLNSPPIVSTLINQQLYLYRFQTIDYNRYCFIFGLRSLNIKALICKYFWTRLIFE